MKAIVTIIKADIRKGKSGFFSILILMFILTMTLAAVLTVNRNSAMRDAQALKEDGFGDLYVLLSDKSLDKQGVAIGDIMSSVKSSGIVKDAGLTQGIGMRIADLNGNTSDSIVVSQNYDTTNFQFKIFKSDENFVYEDKPELRAGEICVPVSYQSMYHCNIGDTLYIKTEDGNKGYTVKYFFEDPFMGGSTMGIKTVLMSNSDFHSLLQSAVDSDGKTIYPIDIVNVFTSDSYSGSAQQFVRDLNAKTSINDYSYICMSTSQATGYMLILINIFCGVLAAFIVLLLIISLIIIGHSISSSIELEYTNIGICKALGFTQAKIKLCILLRYLLAALLGTVLGMPAALPIIALVNKMTRPVTGLSVSSHLAMLQCLLIIIAIFIFIVLYIVIKIRKVAQIKPVRAIAGGRQEIYYKSRLQAKIRKPGLNFWMALRQLTSNGKQYIGATLITMLLVFFLIMVTSMCLWVGNGQNIQKVFTCYNSDLDIQYVDNNVRQDVENTINQYTQITDSFSVYGQYINLNNTKLQCIAIEKPEEISSIRQGRSCLYDNEVLVTQLVAKDLGVNVGDTVTVSLKGKSQDYIVSGIYQCGNDLGSNFAMSEAGYERLMGSEMDQSDCNYVLKDAGKKKAITDAITQAYADKIKISEESSSFIDTIVAAVAGIATIIYLIAIVFVAVIVFMLCEKLFLLEKTDIGIYKAVGFASKRLRKQFAMRFAVVAAIGSVLGLVLRTLLAGACMNMLFSFMGMGGYSLHKSLDVALIPSIFMVVIFYLFAYVLSRKIKRVNTRILISE